MSFEFEWDGAKAEENVKNHGVAFDEALTAFADPLARIFDDPTTQVMSTGKSSSGIRCSNVSW